MPTSIVVSFAQILRIPHDSINPQIAFYSPPHPYRSNNNTVLVCEENTCFMNEHMSLLRQCHNTQDTTTLMRMYCLVQLIVQSMSAAKSHNGSCILSIFETIYRGFSFSPLHCQLEGKLLARGTWHGVEARWCISYDITVEKFLHTTKLSRLSLSQLLAC